MIRRLTLLRHAETSPVAPGQADADRALTPRGVQQCAELATYLESQTFDTVAISPSLRTRETARLALGEAAGIEVTTALYQAAADTIAGVTATFFPTCCNALIVAHNPGISVFAGRLSRMTVGEMRPCTAVSLIFDGDWLEMPNGRCRLDWQFNPEDR